MSLTTSSIVNLSIARLVLVDFKSIGLYYNCIANFGSFTICQFSTTYGTVKKFKLWLLTLYSIQSQD